MTESIQTADFGSRQAVQPPDVQVAANPSVIVEAVSSTLSVWPRATNPYQPLAVADLNAFFNAPTGSVFGQPRLAYDAATSHFFLTGIVATAAGASTEYIAISRTSDPLGLWNIYSVHVFTNIIGDQPKLGYNSKVVVISWADFNAADQFVGQETWVLDKAQLIAGGAVAHTTVGPDLTRFDIVPAVSVSPTDTEYLTYNNSCGNAASSVSSCTATTPTVGLISITGSPAAAGGITWHEDDPQVASTALPPATPGSAAPGVLTGDDRFLSTTYAYGNVLTSGGDSCQPDGDLTQHACARVVRVAVSGATPSVSLDVAVGVNSQDVAFPAATTDPAGNIFIAAEVIGSSPTPTVLSIEAGTNFVSRQAFGQGDPLDVHPGDRWGEYSSAAPDPTNPYDILVGVESVGRPTTLSWASRVGIATLAAPQITGLSPASGPLFAGTLVTIIGHDLALNEFQHGMSVTFDGVPVTIAKINSLSSVTVVAPGHLPGPVHVQVTSDNGTSATSAADVYSYVPAPALVTRDSHGLLAMYPGNGAGGFAARRQLGTGWISFTAILGPGDFDGDRHVDLMARTAAGGLVLYRGTGSGGFASPRTIGSGWQHFTAILTPGDFDGDGHVDLIGRLPSGALLLYPGNGTGGFLASRTIGSGWQSFTAIVGTSDFDGDGHADLIARSSAGALILYPGNGTGLFRPARTIGSGWSPFTAIIGPGDFNGDGHADLITRLSSGALYLYPGSGSGGFLPARAIGSGWQSFTAIVAVGDPGL